MSGLPSMLSWLMESAMPQDPYLRVLEVITFDAVGAEPTGYLLAIVILCVFTVVHLSSNQKMLFSLHYLTLFSPEGGTSTLSNRKLHLSFGMDWFYSSDFRRTFDNVSASQRESR